VDLQGGKFLIVSKVRYKMEEGLFVSKHKVVYSLIQAVTKLY